MLNLLMSLSLVVSAPAAGAVNYQLSVCDDVTDPQSMDPHKEFSEKNHTLLQQIYEGLVRFDPDGKIEPALAVSWQRVDPLRMRFKLRPNVQFHNGEPFNAEDVKFSIERYLNPATGFPALGLISSLDKVEIIDPYTVDIITKFPDGLLLNRLAGFILIVPSKYVMEHGEFALQSHPIGTGPFEFVRWEKGKEIALTKNKNYWMAGYPKIDSLIFKFIPSEKQVDALLKGDVDILTELPGTQTTLVAKSPNTRIVKRESLYTMVASFNVSQGPLKDQRVRQALNYAVNRADLIRYDVLGNGRVIATMSMPGEEGHNSDLKPYPYDPQKARKLLREAGYPQGLELKALVKEQGLRTAKIIQEQFARVGIRMKIQTTTDATMVRDMASQFWDFGFGGCPDPMVHTYFIQNLVLYSKSPYSIAHYEKFDRLLEDMLVTLDTNERTSKAYKIDKLIYDEALSLFTYQRIKTYGVRNNLHFVPSVTGMPYFFLVDTNEK